MQPQPFLVVLLEDNQFTLSSFHTPPVACLTPPKLDSQDLSVLSISLHLISASTSLSKRLDSLLIDYLIEIAWAFCPWGEGGSRFGRLPLATKSCHSGRKPGLNLQREIIECVFIHDQSFVQKVLGHLDRKINGGYITFTSATYIYTG